MTRIRMGSVFWGSRSPLYQTHATIRSWPVDLRHRLLCILMPEIPVGAQIFDVVFHPTFSTVYTGLLTGYVKAFSYDDQGNHKPAFSVRPSKSSCRGLSLDQDGSHLYAVGKGKSLKYVIRSLWHFNLIPTSFLAPLILLPRALTHAVEPMSQFPPSSASFAFMIFLGSKAAR